MLKWLFIINMKKIVLIFLLLLNNQIIKNENNYIFDITIIRIWIDI